VAAHVGQKRFDIRIHSIEVDKRHGEALMSNEPPIPFVLLQ
jgi:hypothetical protein